MEKLSFLLQVLLLLALFIQCHPTYEASRVDAGSLEAGVYEDLQAKIFRSNNDIVTFPDGFTIGENYVSGKAVVKNETTREIRRNVKIPFEEVTAMTTYEETTSGGRYFGSVIFGLTAPALTFMGIYCLACPKCCFGSCPTIYVFDGKEYVLEAELFSECISKQLENNDLDLLKQNYSSDELKIKITNEALETHYINNFEIVVAEHSPGTEIYPTNDNNLLIITDMNAPSKAVNKEGINVTHLLERDDNTYYRSGVEKISELKTGPVLDWIDLTIPNNKSQSNKIIVKYRNTLLSTTLLYDVVIGSQGVDGLAWTKMMNEDANYASRFKMIYEAFSGIKLKVLDNGVWKNLGRLNDAGPLNWKYIAAKIPQSSSDSLQLRLEFIPDNFMIDYIGFDSTSLEENDIKTYQIYPSLITDGYGNQSDSLLSFIKDNDEYYLKTEPGDNYNLTYKIPSDNNSEKTILIYSKGYYNEWIRGNWINNKNYSYTFNLNDINGTLSALADSWIQNSELLENEFFHSRFYLKEKK